MQSWPSATTCTMVQLQTDVMPGPSGTVVQQQTDVMPGPSGIVAQGLSRITSTPGIVHDIHVVSTPSVSGVSTPEPEHTDDR